MVPGLFSYCEPPSLKAEGFFPLRFCRYLAMTKKNACVSIAFTLFPAVGLENPIFNQGVF